MLLMAFSESIETAGGSKRRSHRRQHSMLTGALAVKKEKLAAVASRKERQRRRQAKQKEGQSARVAKLWGLRQAFSWPRNCAHLRFSRLRPLFFSPWCCYGRGTHTRGAEFFFFFEPSSLVLSLPCTDISCCYQEPGPLISCFFGAVKQPSNSSCSLSLLFTLCCCCIPKTQTWPLFAPATHLRPPVRRWSGSESRLRPRVRRCPAAAFVRMHRDACVGRISSTLWEKSIPPYHWIRGSVTIFFSFLLFTGVGRPRKAWGESDKVTH